jgi:hypothetical protein
MAKKETRGGWREGSGKPVQGKTPTQKVTLTLPEHLVIALDKKAYSRTSASRSALVAELLAKALKVKL